MKSFSLRALMTWVLVAALVILAFDRVFFAWRRDAERAIRTNSTTTGFQIAKNSYIHTSLTAEQTNYSLGDYGICEIANTRIAVRGYVHHGSRGSSGGITLATDCDLVGGGGFHGGSGQTFSRRGILGGSHCSFGPISFDIIDGTLFLIDEEFDIINGSQLIVIDRAGKIEDTVEIPVFQKPPEWTPAEPRIAPKSR